MELLLSKSRLRPATMADAASIARHANNPRIWRNLRDTFPFPYSVADAEAYISAHADDDPTRLFVIVVEGEAVGGIGLHTHSDIDRRMLEIGYWLGEPFWGRGIVTEAVEALTAYGFATFDVNRIEAGVFGWNPASARVLEKAGYVFEGRLRNAVTKDGETTDRLMYSVVR